MNLSTGSLVRWPGSFPIPICTSAATKITGFSGSHNPRIQELMKAHNLKDTAALQTYFNQQLLPILRSTASTWLGGMRFLRPACRRMW